MRNLFIILLTAVLAIFGVTQLGLHRTAPELPRYQEVADFKLVDQEGREFTANELAGKVHIIQLFFTSCPKVCPLVTSEVVKLKERLAGHERVRFISISIDPETDNVSALRAYAEKYKASAPAWRLLTGDPAVIKGILNNLALNTEEKGMHSTRLILVDKNRTIRGYYSTDTPETIDQLKEAAEEIEDGS